MEYVYTALPLGAGCCVTLPNEVLHRRTTHFVSPLTINRPGEGGAPKEDG